MSKIKTYFGCGGLWLNAPFNKARMDVSESGGYVEDVGGVVKEVASLLTFS